MKRITILLSDGQPYVEDKAMSYEDDPNNIALAKNVLAGRLPNAAAEAANAQGANALNRQLAGAVRSIGVIAAELEEALRASGRIRALREELDAAMGKIRRNSKAKGTP